MELIKLIDFPTKGLRVEIYDSVILVRSNEDMKILSSAVKNGGLKMSKNILNMSVKWMYYSLTPEKEIERYEDMLGVKDIVGMMTSADVRKASIRHRDGVTVVATAGASNAATPGEEVKMWHKGTINIIVIVENEMRDEALANSIITVTEAKSQVFNILDIRSVNSGRPATGTTTDCVAIATMGRGDEAIRYTSSGTDIGRTIGKLVYECVLENILMNNRLYPDRPFANRALERKLDLKSHFEQISKRLEDESLPSFDKLEDVSNDIVRYLYVSGLKIYDEFKNDKGAEREPLLRALKIIGREIAKVMKGSYPVEDYNVYINNKAFDDIIEEEPLFCLSLGLMMGLKNME